MFGWETLSTYMTPLYIIMITTQYQLFTVQFEQLLEPYLQDTNLGLPYWDWTKNCEIPDLWRNIRSPVKEWNEKRNSDFEEFEGYTIRNWRSNCRSPTRNIGEYALRNKNLQVICDHNKRKVLVDGIKDVMESDNYYDLLENLEVRTKTSKNVRI